MTIANRLLVELDCLLDTRIATVARLSQAAAKKLLTKEYRSREMDDFETLTGGLVTNDAFREMYAKRDVETLKMSRCTGMPLLLNQFIKTLEQQRITSAEYDEVVVEVNVYPYQLKADEQEMLVNSVMAYAGVETQVKVVSLTPQEITPNRIRSDWDTLILYDFDGWFKYHHEEMNTIKNPTRTMFVPALYLKRPKEDDLELEHFPNMTYFQVMEGILFERLSLEMLHPRFFSLVDL